MINLRKKRDRVILRNIHVDTKFHIQWKSNAKSLSNAIENKTNCQKSTCS